MADIDSVFVGIEWNGFAIYREGFLAVWFRDKSKIIALIFASGRFCAVRTVGIICSEQIASFAAATLAVPIRRLKPPKRTAFLISSRSLLFAYGLKRSFLSVPIVEGNVGVVKGRKQRPFAMKKKNGRGPSVA